MTGNFKVSYYKARWAAPCQKRKSRIAILFVAWDSLPQSANSGMDSRLRVVFRAVLKLVPSVYF
jgi:hypothetical protein